MTYKSEKQWPTFPFFGLHEKRIRSKFRPWVIGATLLIFCGILLLPVPEGLTREGLNAIAIFFLCLAFWVTNAIPLMITSIMAIILLPLLGVLDERTAFSLFGNQAVFFILGAFILASAIMRSGLSTRIALMILRLFNKSQRSLLLGLLLLPAALSCVMSEHAVVAMMFPIVLEITKALGISPGSKYGMSLFFAMAWGAIIGGIVTFLGGARAILAVGMLEEMAQTSIGFTEWTVASFPVAVIMLIVAYIMLLFIIRKEKHTITSAEAYLKRKVSSLGSVTSNEKYIGALMCITIVLWITVGHEIGLATIALAAVVVAFIFKLLSWKNVQTDVNWGIFLMYGGAIALGFALNESGAAAWLIQTVLHHWVESAIVLVIIISLLAKVLTEGISNTAVVALLMPIIIALSQQFSLDPRIATLALAIPSGLAFMLPMSTPATAIAISSSYVRVSDTLRTGLVLNIISFIVFIAVVFLYWPLIGYTI